MKSVLQFSALTALLSLTLNLNAPALAQQQQQQQTQQQPAPIPDAPAPQQAAPPLTDAANGPIKPGGGAGTETSPNGSSNSSGDIQGAVPQPDQPAPPTAPPSTTPQTTGQQQTPPETPPIADLGQIIRVYTTLVEVPVTVKDSKGNQVAGLTWRDFKVYENNQYEPLRYFFTDARPMSIVFVVDQSLPKDVMAQVNDSLGSIQGSLTPYDELAVFTYGNGPQNRSGGFTGAQSARVPYLLSMVKSAGTEQLNPVNDGPFASCNIRENGNCVDPNLQAGKSAGSGYFMTIPKEIHTLNDAIFAAGKLLSDRPKERRRIIYVISDGKENGSKATYKEVVKYLQTNHIAVYGTLVGEAARWGEGRLSRFRLPFTMYDNILVKYTIPTGGLLDSENGVGHIEKSYMELAREARTQYTLFYSSHIPPFDSRFRKITVIINRPNLEVIAPQGYYPNATDANSH